jgi:hypothetical protein
MEGVIGEIASPLIRLLRFDWRYAQRKYNRRNG